MIILIDRSAGTVSVDGEARTVDTFDLPMSVKTITFNSALGIGEVVFDPNLEPPQPNKPFGAFFYKKIYAKYQQAWRVAGA